MAEKMELNLEVIKQRAQENEDENFEFRSFLKGWDFDEVDWIVHRLHNEIVPQIDCTQCGNCCGVLRPSVSDKEIDRLSVIDGISRQDFEMKYVAKEDSEDINYLKDMPCKYLRNKKCTIYAHRPEDCRSYPHTHKDKFVSRLLGVIDNYEICPIVYNLYERLKIESGFKKRRKYS